jgi:chromate reductase
MKSIKKIMTLGGSSSRKSINKQLAEYVGSLVRDVELVKVDLNDYTIPLYSIDIENEHGIPKSVTDLIEVIEQADGIVISLAEHNGSYSAAFKNAFDWMSRVDGKVWRNKPMLLLSTSPGPRGGKSVLEAALNRFPYSGGNIIGSLSFPSFNQNFQEGAVVNQELKTNILQHIAEFENAI